MSIDWAHSHAAELLKPLGDRWFHTRAVANQADRVSSIFPTTDADALHAAAYLHDVGYAPQLARTGFHPLDAAIHLKECGVNHRVCCLVAHHSAARFEAEERGLLNELAAYAREDGPVMDALIYADMTTGSAGQRIEFEERMDEILRRYGEEDPVGRVISRRARPELRAAVTRTERLLSSATRSADVGG